MATATLDKKNSAIGTLEIQGEKFAVLKKQYLDELLILLNSVAVGEKLLKEGKTRSFNEFLIATKRKK